MRRPTAPATTTALAALLSACVSTSATLYVEPLEATLDIRRVAVVPNRLPLNLTNSRYWEDRNAEFIARRFERRGFAVVDLGVARQAFERSGLPVEDTSVSREKHAELAAALGVDAVVVPYYGTQSNVENYFLVNDIRYGAVVTLQIYLAEANDFFARIDASGTHNYLSGIGLSVGLVLMLVASDPDSAEVAAPLALSAMVGGALADLGMGLFVRADARWGSAFDSALVHGLDEFFARFPGPARDLR